MNTKILLTTLLLTLSSLSFAQYTTVDAEGNVVKMSAAAVGGTYGGSFDQNAFDQFDSYAKTTGGQMGFCPEFKHLPKIMDSLLKAILENGRTQQDIVLSLDTTGSMTDEIEAVKKNLTKLVEDLSRVSGKEIEISVVLYKDQNQEDPFVAKVLSDLSSDLQTVKDDLKLIEVNGGGDHPEAVLDSLELIASEVHFRLNSNKTIILIGDAPGHETSKLTGRTTNEVLALFGTVDASITVNPILVSNIGPMPIHPGLPGTPVPTPFFGTEEVE